MHPSAQPSMQGIADGDNHAIQNITRKLYRKKNFGEKYSSKKKFGENYTVKTKLGDYLIKIKRCLSTEMDMLF